MAYGTVENVATKAQVDGEDIGFGTESEFESFIEDLLESATEEINMYLGRDLEGGTQTVQVDGNGRDTVKLPDYPVESIDSVVVDGIPVESSEYRAKSSGILERRQGQWVDGWENIEVSYTYASNRGVQDEVAEEMAKDALVAADTEAKAAGTDSVSMDGYSASFDTSTHMQMTEAYRSRLKPFREVGVR